MKIFSLPGIKDISTTPVYDAIADSSITPWRKPFFIPDFDTRFTMCVTPLVVLSRLGKTIPMRFAPRYYTEGMMGIIFRAADMYDTFVAQHRPAGLALSFDNSLLVSPKMPVDVLSRIWNEGIDIRINGKTVIHKRCVDVTAQADMAIHLLSGYITLKTGDVLCLDVPDNGVDVVEGDEITLTETSTGNLIHSFNIK